MSGRATHLSPDSFLIAGQYDRLILPIESLAGTMPAETEYKSYLLRLWQVNSGGKLVWRASLEGPHTGAPHTGARLGFASVERLIAFLKDQTSGTAHSESEKETTDRPTGPC
jgi:hypothetical protein